MVEISHRVSLRVTKLVFGEQAFGSVVLNKEWLLPSSFAYIKDTASVLSSVNQRSNVKNTFTLDVMTSNYKTD